jgi:pyruvate/2-oxoglutarate dehydrogenase complex dihydrolipoamide dehydrogenase (E3) component
MACDYDLLVIGSGPAGHRAAIQAAKLEKRVAVVEKKAVVGGVWINAGTIPSKTLREAALRLSGYRERGIYGASYTVKQHITMRDLLFRVIGAEAAELVYIGQAVLALGGPVDYFVDTVFNYPTLAECYKTAAFDGVNRLGFA